MRRFTPCRTAGFTMAASLLCCCAAGCRGPVDHPEIRAVLDAQTAAWNAGDLEGYMSGYWKSDALTFTTPDETTQGWQATLERYRRRYPTQREMGALKFEEVVIGETGPDAAHASGRYRLRRADGEHRGRFYLTWRKVDGSWVIVRDHTVAER